MPKFNDRATRRGALKAMGGAIAAASGLTVGPLAARAASGDDDGQDPRDLPRSMRPRVLLPNNRRFYPSRAVVALIRDGAAEGRGETVLEAYAARLAARYEPRAENRAPIGKAIGGLGGWPFLDRISPRNRVGRLHRAAEDVVIAVDDAQIYQTLLADLGAPVVLITRTPRQHDLVSLEMPLRFERISVSAPPQGLGAPIGSAHSAARRLVLAPPRDQLPGFDLF